MLKEFERPIGGQSVVNEVIDRLTNAILNGDLRPGQKIATETELSQLWKVGRNSVREAIKSLVYIGVLEIRRSEGTFVADKFSDKMLNPLLYSLMLECDASESLIELRRLFEVGALDLAIDKGTRDDFHAIKEAHENMIVSLQQPQPDVDKILDQDLVFHHMICRACHNSQLERINTVIARLTAPSRKKTITVFLDKRLQEFMIESHEQLYCVLIDRNKSRIIPSVDYHYSYWEKDLTRR